MKTATQKTETPSLYAELVAAGVEIDHHESDLYVRRTIQACAILSRYPEYHYTAATFLGTDGELWIDVPFAYLPFWPTELVLKDRGRGRIFLTLRAGVVTGAMGSDPKRYIGLTEAEARHVARYGGRRTGRKETRQVGANAFEHIRADGKVVTITVPGRS